MTVELTRLQTKAIKYLTDEFRRNVLFGGAKGPGKSFLLCHWVHYWCNYLSILFKLSPSENPIPLGFIGRKQSVDFRKTTLETWKRVIPSRNYVIKEQQSEIILFDGVCKISFGGLDSQDTINKFNSAEYAFFALDQAEETSREDVAVLRGSLRLKINGVQPPYKELYTANPSDCWLKEDFVDEQISENVYVPALPSDNPHLPDNYIQTLETAFKHSPALLRAYRDGDWSALKSTNNLLSSDDINKLQGISISYSHNKRVVVCDPATSHDECVIYCMHNYGIIDQQIISGETDEMKIAGMIAIMARKHKVIDVGGDTIGLGSGIFSRLSEIGEFVIHSFKSSENSFNDQFLNKRAEAYWLVMQKIIDKKIPYIEDEELRRQLTNTSYEVIGSNGKIRITSKDKLKSIIGRSPDRADAFVMGVWISDSADYWRESKKKDSYSHSDNEYDFNPATV